MLKSDTADRFKTRGKNIFAPAIAMQLLGLLRSLSEVNAEVLDADSAVMPLARAFHLQDPRPVYYGEKMSRGTKSASWTAILLAVRARASQGGAIWPSKASFLETLEIRESPKLEASGLLHRLRNDIPRAEVGVMKSYDHGHSCIKVWSHAWDSRTVSELYRIALVRERLYRKREDLVQEGKTLGFSARMMRALHNASSVLSSPDWRQELPGPGEVDKLIELYWNVANKTAITERSELHAAMVHYQSNRHLYGSAVPNA